MPPARPNARRQTLALAATFLLAACGGQAANAPPAPAASGAAVASASAPAPAGAGETPRAEASAASQAPAAAGDGIQLSAPVALRIGERALPAVLVTNGSAETRSFTVSATWQQDGATVTAQGAVFNLRPGASQAVNLASQQAIPSDLAAGEVRVTRELPVDQAQMAAEAKITFGPPKVEKGALSQVAVSATNLDLAPHSFNAGAALLRKGVLIGTASGTVSDIPPMLTLPASLTIAGEDSGYDQILVYITALTK